MKAVLCREFGPPSALVLGETPAPKPGRGEVLIRVEAAAVNFPDTLIIQGKYQAKPPLPFPPGGEVAGRVEALGEGLDGPAPGTRVLAMTGHGGFAELAVAPAGNIVVLPDDIDAVPAAALSYAYGTVLHALQDRAALRPGETVLVLGAAGGAGMAAVQVAKLMGARVIAAASPAKHAACREAGADAVVDYTAEHWREELKTLAPDGVEVVFDAVGGPYAEPSLRSIAWGGRYLVVGFASGDIPRIPLNLTLLKGCAILGVFYGAHVKRDPEGNRALMARLFDWIRSGALKPAIAQAWPLERAPEALELLLARKVTGKIVLRI
ncbi:NADPH:quinone oxidoreductase family protein [Roseicella aquatilis]|uniref:NADPH:quinone oxidoreductase family protein n=1 Tax=Roseicella aquatilis TaxID=2527868 RepID=A0A4R4DSA7_9PROT|nr:NADPH:quinone oxidoreductase family protein [Roseicella aquatilis]TCZ65479.1 NADPH:quinone oxidoreductase family protein [Roseicella aquatilis]